MAEPDVFAKCRDQLRYLEVAFDPAGAINRTLEKVRAASRVLVVQGAPTGELAENQRALEHSCEFCG